jgi:hypothetical protein
VDNFPALAGKIGHTKFLKPMYRGLSSRVAPAAAAASAAVHAPAAAAGSGAADGAAASAAAPTKGETKEGTVATAGAGSAVAAVAAAAAAAASSSSDGTSTGGMSPAVPAAPSVTPLTDIEGLYLTSRDVVGVNSLQGELMGAWLSVHAMLGYRLIDVKLHGRNVSEEILAHTPK